MRFYSKMQTSIAKVGNDETCWANILCCNFLHALQCTQNTPCCRGKGHHLFLSLASPQAQVKKDNVLVCVKLKCLFRSI